MLIKQLKKAKNLQTNKTMVQIGFKIKKETKQKLARLANKQDRSISSVARIAIEKGLLFFDKGGSHQSKKI